MTETKLCIYNHQKSLHLLNILKQSCHFQLTVHNNQVGPTNALLDDTETVPLIDDDDRDTEG